MLDHTNSVYDFVLARLIDCKDILSTNGFNNSLLYRTIITLIEFISDLL